MDVHEAMALGEQRYASALSALARFGRATFTQTGGMCAALEVRLERGYLLVTDAEDSVPWDPVQLQGWGVGFYWSDDVSEGPEVFVSSDDTDPDSLGQLVARCLQETRAELTRR